MRDLEFLPDWYPKLRQRRRVVVTQAWVTIAVAAILGLWMLFAQRNVSAREHELADINMSLRQSVTEVARLETLLELQRKLSHQDQIFAKIGRPIETTRILTTLAELMPTNMSLLNLAVITEEPKVETLAAKAAQDKGTNKRVGMKLQGVAPTDSDLAGFLAKLTAKPFFSNVAVAYSKPRSESGHSMREFEVTFALDLGGLGGN